MLRTVLAPMSGALLALFLWLTQSRAPNVPVVTVQRGDVHQVCVLTAQLTYADEAVLRADGGGWITRVCVSAGQRVGAGDALIRFVDGGQAASVLRAVSPCTIREVYAAEDTFAADGMVLLRVSSHQQALRCTVSAEAGNALRTGMWGWMSADGQALGFAEITRVGSGRLSTAIDLRPDRPIDLPEGATVSVAIFLAGSDDVLSLPVEAVTPRGTVWWVHDGKCTEIPAEIVLSDEKRAWVRLPEGLAVAVGEYREGQRIRGEMS